MGVIAEANCTMMAVPCLQLRTSNLYELLLDICGVIVISPSNNVVSPTAFNLYRFSPLRRCPEILNADYTFQGLSLLTKARKSNYSFRLHPLHYGLRLRKMSMLTAHPQHASFDHIKMIRDQILILLICNDNN